MTTLTITRKSILIIPALLAALVLLVSPRGSAARQMQPGEAAQSQINPGDDEGSVERSLVALPAASATVAEATLVQTIDTSLFVPPSPDPSAIVYLPDRDTMLAADSEVNEMPIFTGDNLFEMSRTGVLSETLTTISFSDEPRGITLNPANNHLFISDTAGPRRVYELDPGPDGKYDTPDDTVTEFSTTDFGASDPDGLTFDPNEGVLFIAGGTDNAVFRVDPGPNGDFDGVPPTGDDEVTSFETTSLGVTNPEGIVYDEFNGFLYLIGTPKTLLAHITTGGDLVRVVDISAASPAKPSGLGYGPGSLNPGVENVWVTDRGVDNDVDPTENDGKVHELSIPPLTQGNLPPVVDAGPNQNVTLPDMATLEGVLVSDDGVPVAATTTWSQASGPGTVTFANANALDTTAVFSLPGTYVLRLSAEDTELSSSDDVTIEVTGDPGVSFLDIQIVNTDPISPTRSTDDAEEVDNVTSSLTRFSPDLDMMYDQGTTDNNRFVGTRFVTVTIPTGATISNAFVQFQVDEATSGATSLVVKGQAADNPGTFAFDDKMSTRIPTSAGVLWSPEPWLFTGDATPQQRTPDISSIVQEIVDRPGWASGNAMVLLIEGSGERVASAFERDPAAAPVLHVEFYVNQPPMVDAGPDQSIRITETAVLDGTVVDDGPAGSHTNVWSKISGPGTVTFGDERAVDTTAVFSQIGTYVLRLTADDGEFNVFDELTITVESPGVDLYLPIVHK